MFQKLFFSISAQDLRAAYKRRGKLIDCGVFINSPLGWQEFNRFLADYSGVPAFIMVNAVEEDYRVEVLPHTQGRARKALIDRKLAQMFRNHPYRAALIQGQQTTQRREDVFLFCALSNTELLRPWIERLNANHVPVAGVYLLPLVSELLLGALSAASPYTLLVSEHSTGLRQSFFKNGKLKASRFSFTDHVNKNNQADYAAEIDRTLLYLHGMKTLNPDDALTFLVLDPTNTLKDLCKHYTQDANIRCIHINSSILQKLRGMTPRLMTSSDLVHLYALAERGRPVNLAPAAVLQNFGAYQAKRLLYSLSGALLLVGTIWSAINLWRYQEYENRADQAELETQNLSLRYREAARRFPAAPASSAELEAAVKIAQQISAKQQTPERLMHAISTALENHPQVQLQGLRWNSGNPEVGVLEGEIKPFRGDYRAAIAEVAAFNRTLASSGYVNRTQVVAWPLNLSSTEGVSGSTQDEEKGGEVKAQFKLEIEMKRL